MTIDLSARCGNATIGCQLKETTPRRVSNIYWLPKIHPKGRVRRQNDGVRITHLLKLKSIWFLRRIYLWVTRNVRQLHVWCFVYARAPPPASACAPVNPSGEEENQFKVVKFLVNYIYGNFYDFFAIARSANSLKLDRVSAINSNWQRD